VRPGPLALSPTFASSAAAPATGRQWHGEEQFLADHPAQVRGCLADPNIDEFCQSIAFEIGQVDVMGHLNQVPPDRRRRAAPEMNPLSPSSVRGLLTKVAFTSLARAITSSWMLAVIIAIGIVG
jgi:hypothetical protein